MKVCYNLGCKDLDKDKEECKLDKVCKYRISESTLKEMGWIE